MHKSFWLPREAGCVADENMEYENCSQNESKRGQQWFVEGGESGILNNKKKQAVEAINGRPVSGNPHLNGVPWDATSGFQSVPGHFADRLFVSEDVRTANLVDRNIPSAGSENLNMGRKDFENQYENDSPMGLSMSHSFEDPTCCINFGGIRKVKVNQVRDMDKGVPVSMGHSYSGADNSIISVGACYDKGGESIISLNPSFNNANENIMAMGTAFSKEDENLASLGSTFSKGDGSFMLMGHNYGKGDESLLSMGQSFQKLDGKFISMGQTYGKEDSNVVSLGTSYNKGSDNFILMGTSYGKDGGNLITIGSCYEKGNSDHIMSLNSTSNDSCPSYAKEDSSSLPVGLRYNKGEGCNISFGTFHDESEADLSGGIISSYDLLLAGPCSAQASQDLKESTESNGEANINSLSKGNAQSDFIPKNKEPKATKKVSPGPNTFPSNVKSLLSTGIFDGVPVKYVSWSREKNLEGVIKGTGYLCSCDNCRNSKALNAYEFERHAGAKTKHPNNHIYFENGKTIYAVVQELKNTPQEKLFDVIQTVTGSPINQKNFRVWKASFQAATRELQRIYGKDEAGVQS